jgi:hypothetical protein
MGFWRLIGRRRASKAAPDLGAPAEGTSRNTAVYPTAAKDESVRTALKNRNTCPTTNSRPPTRCFYCARRSSYADDRSFRRWVAVSSTPTPNPPWLPDAPASRGRCPADAARPSHYLFTPGTSSRNSCRLISQGYDSPLGYRSFCACFSVAGPGDPSHHYRPNQGRFWLLRPQCTNHHWEHRDRGRDQNSQ